MAGKSTVLSVLITGDAKGLKKAFGDSEDDAKGWGAKVGKVAAVAGVALGGVALAAAPAMKKLGDELKIMSDKAATVFGDQLEPMEKWAAQNNRAMGLSKQATLDLATSMSDLLVPMGFTREAAAEQSKTMVGAAGALSAWSKGKFTAAEVSDIMTKAILGETDGLKALGISISQDEVNARLLAKGQKELTGTALAQAKAIATQELIMEKSTDAQTAWADGTMDAVKAQNAAKAKGEELKATLATTLQPAFAALTGVLVNQLIPAFEAFTGFMTDHKAVAIALGAVVGLLVTGLVAYKVATVASTVVTQISAVATGAWTAAQWLLNAALSANPIALVVIAIAALVAGLIIAYEKVGWFHDAVDRVWGILTDTFGWLQRNWPLVLAILTGPFGLAVLAITTHWDTIVGFITGMPGRLAAAGAGMWDWISDQFRGVINSVIGLWNRIEFPSFTIGGWDPPGPGPTIPSATVGGWSVPQIPYMAAGGIVGASSGGTLAMIAEAGHDEAVVPLPHGWRGGMGSTVNVTVVAPVGSSPQAIGRTLQRMLNEYARSGGQG